MQGRRKIGTIEIMKTTNKLSDFIKSFVETANDGFKNLKDAISYTCLQRRKKEQEKFVTHFNSGTGTNIVPWTREAPADVKVVL